MPGNGCAASVSKQSKQHKNDSNRSTQTDDSDTTGLSPSQRYALFQKKQQHAKTASNRFCQGLPFDLDDFQLEAIDELEAGNNVIVAAPTGAGKTIVADFAVFLAQEQNVKAIYTTPIKALSNQKYHDLANVYGDDKVGLLTGDNSINPDADIVVMTTEVLRNMVYERSAQLTALRYVILDEIHYLANRLRGPVWEEVIIHLPSYVKVVGLSATVSNVEDFSHWIASVRGTTSLVVSEQRPVPLEQHVLVQRDAITEPELIDLYANPENQSHASAINNHLISRLNQFDSQASRKRNRDNSRRARAGRHSHSKRGSSIRLSNRYTPKRWAVVDELDYLGMLPGIYFIFSRSGCEQAVKQCMDKGLQLTTEEEAQKIRSIVDDMVQGELSRSDLDALGYRQFKFALEQGIAAHHAGVITLFRQVIERLFEMGLVKVVFATETLALGINMPAKCVVIEQLDKFDGVSHTGLTAGEFTQLTGRAGRRGIDTIGHAIVVDHHGFEPEIMSALSSKRVYPLHSSFKPTFNMAVNLLNSSDYETSRTTLAHSFAQWEANKSSTELRSQITILEQSLNDYEQAAQCSHGDIVAFAMIRSSLSCIQKKGYRALKRQEFPSEADRKRAIAGLDRKVEQLREEERNHPCRNCPDLQDHLKWMNRWNREHHKLELLQERYTSRTGSVARQFDKICEILKKLGYLIQTSTKDENDDGMHWSQDYQLTESGQMLRRIYSEQDLVIAQTLRSGILDNLAPDELVGVLAGLVYVSHRGGLTAKATSWSGSLPQAMIRASTDMESIWQQVANICEKAAFSMDLPELDFGLSQAMYSWSRGESLKRILTDNELTAGDFVRTSKRLIDVLQQIVQIEPFMDGFVKNAESSLSVRAKLAIDLVNRGVVSYTGVD